MKRLWSDLPNAQYIDWVLNSLKENPELWELETRTPMWFKVRNAAFNAAQATEAAAARDKAWDATWDAARAAAPRHWTDSRARAAANSAILALVAYDDCYQYLAMGYEKLKVYAALSDKPQAILLLPMLYVWEKSYQNALNYNCII